MTNEEALASTLEKILLEGDPLVFRGGTPGPGLAFEGMFVSLDSDELLAVVKIVNKIKRELTPG